MAILLDYRGLFWIGGAVVGQTIDLHLTILCWPFLFFWYTGQLVTMGTFLEFEMFPFSVERCVIAALFWYLPLACVIAIQVWLRHRRKYEAFVAAEVVRHRQRIKIKSAADVKTRVNWVLSRAHRPDRPSKSRVNTPVIDAFLEEQGDGTGKN